VVDVTRCGAPITAGRYHGRLTGLGKALPHVKETTSRSVGPIIDPWDYQCDNCYNRRGGYTEEQID
jgi:hypothetical protein